VRPSGTSTPTRCHCSTTTTPCATPASRASSASPAPCRSTPPTPYRSSDHDPVVIGLELDQTGPVVVAVDPADGTELEDRSADPGRHRRRAAGAEQHRHADRAVRCGAGLGHGGGLDPRHRSGPQAARAGPGRTRSSSRCVTGSATPRRARRPSSCGPARDRRRRTSPTHRRAPARPEHPGQRGRCAVHELRQHAHLPRDQDRRAVAGRADQGGVRRPPQGRHRAPVDRASTTTPRPRASTPAGPAATSCSAATPSSTRTAAGPASTHRSPATRSS
jgi:hypothetical protein